MSQGGIWAGKPSGRLLSEGINKILLEEVPGCSTQRRQLRQEHGGGKKSLRLLHSRKPQPLGVVVTPGWVWGCLPVQAGKPAGCPCLLVLNARASQGPCCPGSGTHDPQVVGSWMGEDGEAGVCLEHELYHSVRESIRPSWRLGVIIRQHSWQLGGVGWGSARLV